MKIEEIKTPHDILNYMQEHIQYGWIDNTGKKHIKSMKEFRKIYRTMSIRETIQNGLGCCIEQVNLMHCFILYYQNNKVYQIEHPNFDKIGIYEFNSEQQAIDSIVKYYVELSGGIKRPTTEFYQVPVGLSFKEFNNYINSLDK